MSGAIKRVRGIDQTATRPKSAITRPRVAAWAARLTATSAAISDQPTRSRLGSPSPNAIARSDHRWLFARSPAVAKAERRKPGSAAIAGSSTIKASAACDRATAPEPGRPDAAPMRAAAAIKLARMTLALAPAKRPYPIATAISSGRRRFAGNRLANRSATAMVIATFHPESATTCPSPVAVKSVARRSSTRSLKPITIAAASPPAGAGRTRSIASPRAARSDSSGLPRERIFTRRVRAVADTPRMRRRSCASVLTERCSSDVRMASPVRTLGFGGDSTWMRSPSISTMNRCAPRSGARSAATCPRTSPVGTRAAVLSAGGIDGPKSVTRPLMRSAPRSAARADSLVLSCVQRASSAKNRREPSTRAGAPTRRVEAGKGSSESWAVATAAMAAQPARPPSRGAPRRRCFTV